MTNPLATKKHVARLAQRLAGFMLLVFFLANFFVAVLAATDGVLVSVDGNLISVDAENTAIRDVLTEISRRNGLTVISNLPLDQRTSITIENKPLSKVLSRLLRDENTILEARESGAVLAYTLWVIADGSSRTDVAAHPSLIIDPQVNMGLDDDNPNNRFDAVMDLVDEESSAALAQALADPEPEIREAAVFALAEVGDETSVHLIRQALSDPNQDVRDAAESMLMEVQPGDF